MSNTTSHLELIPMRESWWRKLKYNLLPGKCLLCGKRKLFGIKPHKSCEDYELSKGGNIDIDKMARERRWVKEIPDGMKAIMFMNAETGKEEIYFTPDTFNNLPEKEKTGYVKLERLLTEEEIRNASGHLSNPVSKLRANLQAQDAKTYPIAFEAGKKEQAEKDLQSALTELEKEIK